MNQAKEICPSIFAIKRADRESLVGFHAKVVWLTGLSGAGKSTLANAIEQRLYSMGRLTYVLDGDDLRGGLNRDLGFDQPSRDENIRRAAEVARLMVDAGVIVLAAFISPLDRQRQMARHIIGDADFVEVYVSTPMDVCQQRDPKGLYRKALSGGLQAMTGIGSEYQIPSAPQVIVDTSVESTESTVERILVLLGLGED